MDFIVLDNETFLPSRFVENYSSLVWTERYSTCGDFQLVSSDVSGTLAAIPVDPSDPAASDVFVSLADSDVPMVVETANISTSKTGSPQITITGRAFETVLDRRTTVNAIPSSGPYLGWSISSINSSSWFAWSIAHEILTAGIPADAIHEILFPQPASGVYTVGTTAITTPVSPGELYSTILALVQADSNGFRSSRPGQDNPGKFLIEIIKGVDRTKAVSFDATFDQFDTANYLIGRQTWKNTIQVSTATGMAEQNDGTVYTGLNRRVVYDDLTTDPSFSNVTETGPALVTLLKNAGTIQLASPAFLQTVLFSGTVAYQVANRYNLPYDQGGYKIGDIVKLVGDYGLTQNVRVEEFIRSYDNTGEKAYPTFSSITADNSDD